MANANASTKAYAMSVVSQYITQLKSQSIVEVFWFAFYPTAVILLIQYLLGFCAVSAPVISLLPFVRGLSLGCFLAIAYKSYSFIEILVCIVIVLLPSLVSLFALVISSREACRLSVLLFRCICFGESISSKEVLKRYHLKYAILMLIVALSGIISVVFVFLFSGFIKS